MFKEFESKMFAGVLAGGECDGITVGNVREFSKLAANLMTEEWNSKVGAITYAWSNNAIKIYLKSHFAGYLQTAASTLLDDPKFYVISEESWQSLVARALAGQEDVLVCGVDVIAGVIAEFCMEYEPTDCIPSKVKGWHTVDRRIRELVVTKKERLTREIALTLTMALKLAVLTIRGVTDVRKGDVK